MSDSCFIEKLQAYLTLTPGEKRDLARLEEDPRDYPAGETLFKEDEDPADTLYIVQDGRLHASTILSDGGRAILRLHFPGDIVGTSSIPFKTAASTVTTTAPSRLCRFPRASLTEVFEVHPRIAALFYAIAALENSILNSRLRSVGRTDGVSRVAALLLEISSRINLHSGELDGEIDVGLTQADIGDAIGLTPVHVNRMMRELTERGLISRSGNTVHLLDIDRLTELAHFNDRYRVIATEWFPAPRA